MIWELLGERTIWIDCDVIQADGGTEPPITGAYVAMVMALKKLLDEEKVSRLPLKDFLAATSVGILENGEVVLDLNYLEDSQAKVDMNIVMTGRGEFVEVQGTGEEHPFSKEELNTLLGLAEQGILALIAKQKEVLGAISEQIGVEIDEEGENGEGNDDEESGIGHEESGET